MWKWAQLSAVYLVLDYIHSNTAVFQSTEPTVKPEPASGSVSTSWEVPVEQEEPVWAKDWKHSETEDFGFSDRFDAGALGDSFKMAMFIHSDYLRTLGRRKIDWIYTGQSHHIHTGDTKRPFWPPLNIHHHSYKSLWLKRLAQGHNKGLRWSTILLENPSTIWAVGRQESVWLRARNWWWVGCCCEEGVEGAIRQRTGTETKDTVGHHFLFSKK